ncbi:unnamed protein product [Urochloa decumbens]|uniref:Protein kinase domain-containing protein n=1 Tax=Urochloa decumbens TaxID=240449 RepID=A0ABC9DMW8_9POAL
MEDKHTLALTCCITRKTKIVAGESSGHHDLEKVLKDQNEKPCNLPLQYLQEITNNFSEERELGRGAFGLVYRGVLCNGQVVAVKKLVALPGVHDKHFENEVYHLTRLNHENIIRIVGYCYEIQHILIEHNGKYCFAEVPQRLLCLELLPKGSLEKQILAFWIIAGHKNYPDSTGTCTLDYVEHILQNWWNRFKELKHTSTEKDCEQIKRCIEIGLTCVQTDAAKRPTAREIIESLERCDSTILHVNNKTAADKVNDNFWKKSDLTFDHRKEVHISKRLKIHRDYFGPEEGKPSSEDESCIDILEQAERIDSSFGVWKVAVP